MGKHISQSVAKNKENKQALGNAVRDWISSSKNLSSLKIKMKFGEKGGSDKKKKSAPPKTPNRKERIM